MWKHGDKCMGEVPFGEISNIKPGTDGGKANFETKLEDSLKEEDILGAGYTKCVDVSFLG